MNLVCIYCLWIALIHRTEPAGLTSEGQREGRLLITRVPCERAAIEDHVAQAAFSPGATHGLQQLVYRIQGLIYLSAPRTPKSDGPLTFQPSRRSG